MAGRVKMLNTVGVLKICKWSLAGSCSCDLVGREQDSGVGVTLGPPEDYNHHGDGIRSVGVVPMSCSETVPWPQEGSWPQGSSSCPLHE